MTTVAEPIGLLTIDRRAGRVAIDASGCALLGLPADATTWYRIPSSDAVEQLPPAVRASLRSLCVPAGAGGQRLDRPHQLVAGSLQLTLQAAPDSPDLLLVVLQRLPTETAHTERSSLAELAAAVAHGFNNLLVGVMGNLDLARYADGTEADRLHHLDAALGAAERAAELCRQLLAFSGRGPLRSRDCDVAHEMRRILPLVQQCGHGRVRVHEPTDDHALRAALDTGRFTQALQNLIERAASVGSIDGHIDVTLAPVHWPELGSGTAPFTNCGPITWADGRDPAQGRYVALTIVDDNDADADIGNAFEPSFDEQLDDRSLGLPAAAGILRQHGGALGIARKIGIGTTVIALWPASGPSPVSVAVAPSERRDGAILIVDDDPTVRDVLRLALERLGYRTHAVENGALALAFLDDHPEVLAVVLDQTMPVMGGAETFARLRERTATLPVVLTSGFGDAGLIELATADPHAAFLAKPFALERLRSVLESVLH